MKLDVGKGMGLSLSMETEIRLATPHAHDRHTSYNTTLCGDKYRYMALKF
jgi:hypothetical protein